MSKIQARRENIANRIEELFRQNNDSLHPMAVNMGWTDHLTPHAKDYNSKLKLIRHILKKELQIGPRELNTLLTNAHTEKSQLLLWCLDVDVPDVKPVTNFEYLSPDQKANDELVKEMSDLQPEPIVSPFIPKPPPKKEEPVNNCHYQGLDQTSALQKVQSFKELDELTVKEIKAIHDVKGRLRKEVLLRAWTKLNPDCTLEHLALSLQSHKLPHDFLTPYLDQPLPEVKVEDKSIVPFTELKKEKPKVVQPNLSEKIVHQFLRASQYMNDVWKNYGYTWENRLDALKDMPVGIMTRYFENGQRKFKNRLPIISDTGVVVYGQEGELFRDNGGYVPFFPLDKGDQIISVHLRHFLSRDKEDQVKKEAFYLKDEDGTLLMARTKHIQDLIDRSYFATCDGTKVMLWVSAKSKEWGSHMKPYAVKITGGAKTMKRVRAINTFYLLRAEVPKTGCRFQVIDSDDKENVDGGSIYIRASYFKKILLPHYKGFRNEEEKERAERHCQMLEEAGIFSFRCLIPEGTKGVEAGGMIKGHAWIVPDDKMTRIHGDYDLVTHKINVKHETQGSNCWIFGLNPMFSKEHSRTNVQYLVNYPHLRDEAQASVLNALNEIKHKIFYDKPLEDMAELMHFMEENEEGDNQILLHYRWAAYTLARYGMSLKNSPSILNQVFSALTIPLNPKERVLDKEGKPLYENGKPVWKFTDKINVKLPCSRYCQIFSKTTAEMAGHEVKVDDGHIQYLKNKTTLFGVVTDETWADMIKNHGGCDQDDYFTHLFRTNEKGEKVILILRTPNDIGEYSVLKPMSDKCPKSYWYEMDEDGIPQPSECEWPMVNMSDLPPRYSTCVPQFSYKGTETPTVKKEYDKAFVKDEFFQGVISGGPGAAINTKLGLTLVMKTQVKSMPCAMDLMIDSSVQARDKGLQKALKDWSLLFMERMVAAQKPIDQTFARCRFGKMSEQMNLEEGWITKLCKFIDTEIQITKAWIQENVPFQIADVWARPGSLTQADTKILKDTWDFYLKTTGKKGVDFDLFREELRKNLMSAKDKLSIFHAFTKKLYTTPLAGGQPRSDALLTSGKMWTIYQTCLKKFYTQKEVVEEQVSEQEKVTVEIML